MEGVQLPASVALATSETGGLVVGLNLLKLAASDSNASTTPFMGLLLASSCIGAMSMVFALPCETSGFDTFKREGRKARHHGPCLLAQGLSERLDRQPVFVQQNV